MTRLTRLTRGLDEVDKAGRSMKSMKSTLSVIFALKIHTKDGARLFMIGLIRLIRQMPGPAFL